MADEKPFDGVKALDSTIQFFYHLGVEAYYGIVLKKIPWATCIFMGFLTNLIVVQHWDYFFLKHYHLELLYPLNPCLYWPYYLWSATTGFWLWAMKRAHVRGRRKKQLEEAFRNIGLKSHLNKTPQLVYEGEVLRGVYRLELKAPGFSKDRFLSVKQEMQSQLNFYLDDVKENVEKGTFDIIYAKKKLDWPYKIENVHSIPEDTFVVGNSRAKEIRAQLSTVPHLLVAGETTGGKSTFLRQVITTLYLRNPKYEFVLIDLKEGLEFQIFEKLPRVTVHTDVSQATVELAKYPDILKSRMEMIREAGCVDLPGYLAKMGAAAKFNRLVIVIDEAAELILSGPGRQSQEAQLVKKATSQIARQGRAVGVHIIFATQRPDVKTIPAEIKANLIGTACFQTPNAATSITALGNGMATELSAIKGRAIWKVGPELTEVQTPLLTPDEVKNLLKDIKRIKKPSTGHRNDGNTDERVGTLLISQTP
jgi:hypothetical protein